MSFTGQEDHSISLDAATKLTENFRNSQTGNAILGGYFAQETLKRILDQAGCVGIRIYYAQSDAGVKQYVAVGVTSNQEDLYDGEIAQHSLQCPPYCALASPLNGTA
jgi:hypothetical protein